MNLIKIVRTTYILEDEQDDEQADYWDYFNRSEAMIWSESVEKTPVNTDEIPQHISNFFEEIAEQDY